MQHMRLQYFSAGPTHWIIVTEFGRSLCAVRSTGDRSPSSFSNSSCVRTLRVLPVTVFIAFVFLTAGGDDDHAVLHLERLPVTV